MIADAQVREGSGSVLSPTECPYNKSILNIAPESY